MVDILLNNIWIVILMIFILGLSGLFSGSETAYFNISPRRASAFLKSKKNLEVLAGKLLREPKKLLTSLLLANMIVNVAYFSLVSSFLVKNNNIISGPVIAVLAAVFFFMLLLFGEMLPKSLAFKNSDKICIIAALPCFFCIKILHPIQSILTIIVLEPILRLWGLSKVRTHDISVDQLKELIESTKQSGVISSFENQVLTRIIEMNIIKVRDIIKPRVDMTFCEISTNVEHAKKMMSEKNLSYMPVYDKDIDNIKGVVYLSDIYRQGEQDLKGMIKKAHFIPEQKSIESTFVFFQRHQAEIAFVVDEYGGIAGSVELESVSDFLFGNLPQDSSGLVEQIGPMLYRLSGNLPLWEWAQAFGISSQQRRFTTIAGLITALSDKIPAEGDSVNIRNLKLTVEEVENKRIKSVILSLSDGGQQ